MNVHVIMCWLVGAAYFRGELDARTLTGHIYIMHAHVRIDPFSALCKCISWNIMDSISWNITAI